eukprot:2689259-Pleurochrysis_carterae.AAC.1
MPTRVSASMCTVSSSAPDVGFVNCASRAKERPFGRTESSAVISVVLLRSLALGATVTYTDVGEEPLMS